MTERSSEAIAAALDEYADRVSTSCEDCTCEFCTARAGAYEIRRLSARCAALEQELKGFSQEARQLSVRLANSVVTPESLRAMLSTPSEEPQR